MNKVRFEKLKKLDYGVNESYKTLRTNLSFCGDNVKTILLTSCTPNEGKSVVSLRLAQSLAEDGKKVIMIDSDLRKSVFVGRYGVVSEKTIKGLSHYLTGQADLEDVICETDIQNMHVIFAGPGTPNPTELLGNHYFGRMVAVLRQQYDYIIMDTPPLGSVIDTAIITKVCDGAILVIESNVISYKFAQDVKKQLDVADCQVLGAVLNKVDTHNKGKYRGYYKSYGYRYYSRYYSGYGMGYSRVYGQYGMYGNNSNNNNNNNTDSNNNGIKESDSK